MENNIIFAMVKRQIVWDELAPGRECELVSVSGAKSGIGCLPFAIAGSYPYYVSAGMAATFPPHEALVGLKLASGKLVYMPGVPAIEERWLEHLENCDVLFFDGTFWTDDELIRVQGGGRTARQMGHIPISGAGGSLERLAGLKRPRKIFIHVNNTNPILDEESPEYHGVRQAGWEVAHDGWEFEL